MHLLFTQVHFFFWQLNRGQQIEMKQLITWVNAKNRHKRCTRPNATWWGKVIHWELCTRLKFNYINKWYIDMIKSVLENETHKILWDFEIQTDHSILAKLATPSDNLKEKRNCNLMNFGVSLDHRVKKKETEKINKYLDLAREPKKAVLHEGDSDANNSWCAENLEKNWKSGRIETIQTTALLKSPGDLWRLTVTQTRGKGHKLTLK